MISYLTLLETESDREIFEKLCRENEQAFYLTAFKLLQNEADAEDAVQSCFLKMIENFANYRHKPYIDLVRICYTTIKHNAIDMLRDRQKKADFTEENLDWEENAVDLSPEILDQIIEKYETNLVRQAIMQLEPEEREILKLQYALDLKPKEIAAQLNTTSDIVRKRIYRCRLKLEKILEGFGYESLR